VVLVKEVAMSWFMLWMLLAPLEAGDKPPAPDAVKKEIAKFQGTWKAVAAQDVNGGEVSREEVGKTRLVVEGNTFKLSGKDFTIDGTFTVNPAKTPHTIDVVLKSNDGKETRILGIYQIQGDTRKSCFGLSDKERPTTFSARKGYIGFEWKRN